jgi:hypothetical protein
MGALLARRLNESRNERALPHPCVPQQSVSLVTSVDITAAAASRSICCDGLDRLPVDVPPSNGPRQSDRRRLDDGCSAAIEWASAFGLVCAVLVHPSHSPRDNARPRQAQITVVRRGDLLLSFRMIPPQERAADGRAGRTGTAHDARETRIASDTGPDGFKQPTLPSARRKDTPTLLTSERAALDQPGALLSTGHSARH